MRCTSTPMTPEPSPWRPNAAIASRARSRIERLRRPPAAPRRSGGAAPRGRPRRRRRRPRASPRSAPCSRTPSRSAAASAARKKKRSKTSSKMRRSSWDFASVAASASRKSVGLGPRDLGEHGERVEQLRRAAVDALGAQLLAELDEPRGEAGGTGWRRVGRGGHRIRIGPSAGPAAVDSSATVALVTTIPQRELRNNVSEILRRAEAGRALHDHGRRAPVAELGPPPRTRPRRDAPPSCGGCSRRTPSIRSGPRISSACGKRIARTRAIHGRADDALRHERADRRRPRARRRSSKATAR